MSRPFERAVATAMWHMDGEPADYEAYEQMASKMFDALDSMVLGVAPMHRIDRSPHGSPKAVAAWKRWKVTR